MARSHVAVALGDGTADGQVAVLTVHVVSSRTGVITQPDAEVLDLQRSLLVLALDGDNFTSCLLEFAQLTQEVPEPRLGDDVIWCEDDHLEERWIWILLGRQFASDDLIFLQLKWTKARISDAGHDASGARRSRRGGALNSRFVVDGTNFFHRMFLPPKIFIPSFTAFRHFLGPGPTEFGLGLDLCKRSTPIEPPSRRISRQN